jgi:carbon-monoxide dehydrogenase large subunit
MPNQGVGVSVPRKEDDRFLRGRGQFVGDIKLDGMMDVAFVRSPLAHAKIRTIHVPAHLKDLVYTMADLDGVRPIVAVSALPGYKPSQQWPLARDKVRQVGELVAMCVAPSRAEAEDIAAEIELDLEELPVVVDMLEGRKPDAPLVHESFGDNLYLVSAFEGDIEPAARRADVKVTREIRTARQCMVPIEGRGVVADWSERLDQLTLWSSAQMPHIVRTGLSEVLNLQQSQVRVISPDVGGGFGYKGILLPEEICLGWLAMQRGHPVRWLEDRWRIFQLSLLRLPRSRTGRVDPSWSLRFRGLPRQGLCGGHQQITDTALPWRWPHWGLFRHGTPDRCPGPRDRHGAA